MNSACIIFCVLISVALSQSVQQCKNDTDCTELQFCRVVNSECEIKLGGGDACRTDNMCQSAYCLGEGKCSEHGRPLPVGIIAGIACAGVAGLAIAILCIFCLCKCCRKKEPEPEV